MLQGEGSLESKVQAQQLTAVPPPFCAASGTPDQDQRHLASCRHLGAAHAVCAQRHPGALTGRARFRHVWRRRVDVCRAGRA